MNVKLLLFLFVLVTGALSLEIAAASVGDPEAVVLPMESEIPAGIAAPAGQVPAILATARGVQIYECRAVAGQPGKYEWAFKAPEAELFNQSGKIKLGRHYAGPTWELSDGDKVMSDGGKVIGKLKSRVDAPDGKGIPWLLLEASETHGPGRMADVRSIQRIFTVGGKAPAEAADASKVGQERRVDYTATYVFYVAKP